MNSVHEPCPKIDSETVLSQKLDQKLRQVHKTRNLVQLSTPRRAQARPGGHSGHIMVLGPAVSRPGPDVSQPAWSCRRPRTPAPQLLRPSAYASAPACTPRAPSALAHRPCLAQYRGLAGRVTALCRDTVQQPCCLSHDTKFCIVTHCLIPCLQYNSNPLHTKLQYNLFLAIQLGSSLLQISAPIFFFFVFHYKYIFFNYFQQLEKSLKKLHFFFHFLEQSNKFIKIYFTPFSTTLLLVKS